MARAHSVAPTPAEQTKRGIPDTRHSSQGSHTAHQTNYLAQRDTADHLAEGALKWQYGKVYWVHSKLLLDIEYEGGEKSKGLPAYAHEVRRA